MLSSYFIILYERQSCPESDLQGWTQVESPICRARSRICPQYMFEVRFVLARRLALLRSNPHTLTGNDEICDYLFLQNKTKCMSIPMRILTIQLKTKYFNGHNITFFLKQGFHSVYYIGTMNAAICKSENLFFLKFLSVFLRSSFRLQSDITPSLFVETLLKPNQRQK